jgi:hypothetical protein
MTDPRIVTCRYRSTPHVADGECVNASDVDEQVIADLRRLFAADRPPALEVHPSHHPEPPGASLLKGCTACVVCCLIVTGTRGALPAGIRPCKGPGRVELRGAG